VEGCSGARRSASAKPVSDRLHASMQSITCLVRRLPLQKSKVAGPERKSTQQKPRTTNNTVEPGQFIGQFIHPTPPSPAPLLLGSQCDKHFARLLYVLGSRNAQAIPRLTAWSVCQRVHEQMVTTVLYWICAVIDIVHVPHSQALRCRKADPWHAKSKTLQSASTESIMPR
jgi:hypothetical protein